MKYTCTVEIELPAAKVVQLFDNRRDSRSWQEGFVSIEHDLPPLTAPLVKLEPIEHDLPPLILPLVKLESI